MSLRGMPGQKQKIACFETKRAIYSKNIVSYLRELNVFHLK